MHISDEGDAKFVHEQIALKHAEDQKPFKGHISNWFKRAFDQSAHTSLPSNLGYIICGRPSGHPVFKDRIYTSAVVKHEGNQVETLNSRYELVGEAISTSSQKISKSDF